MFPILLFIGLHLFLLEYLTRTTQNRLRSTNSYEIVQDKGNKNIQNNDGSGQPPSDEIQLCPWIYFVAKHMKKNMPIIHHEKIP